MDCREIQNKIINNIRMLYNMGYCVMGKSVPVSQYALTSNIIRAFKDAVPHPVGMNYIFENPGNEEHIMVEITDKGYITMRTPTAEELEDYWKEWE